MSFNEQMTRIDNFPNQETKKSREELKLDVLAQGLDQILKLISVSSPSKPNYDKLEDYVKSYCQDKLVNPYKINNLNKLGNPPTYEVIAKLAAAIDDINSRLKHEKI